MKKTWLLSLLLVCCTTPSWAAIAYVTSPTAGSAGWDGAGGSTVATGAWSLTAGNFVAVCVRWELTGTQTISSVTDTAGNTYTDSGSGRLTMPSNSGHVQMFYAENTTAHASNVVTATFSDGSTRYRNIVAAEYSGVKTSSSADTGNTGTAANALTVTSTAFTPSETNTVAIACAGRNGQSGDIVPDGNYTERSESTNSGGGDGTRGQLDLQDRIGAPASSQTASASDDATNDWWGIIVRAFKQATAAARRPIPAMVMP